jgi:hypothetical protein
VSYVWYLTFINLFKFQDVAPAKAKPSPSSKEMKKQKPGHPKPITYRKSIRPHVEIEYEYESATTAEKSRTSY